MFIKKRAGGKNVKTGYETDDEYVSKDAND